MMILNFPKAPVIRERLISDSFLGQNSLNERGITQAVALIVSRLGEARLGHRSLRAEVEAFVLNGLQTGVHPITGKELPNFSTYTLEKGITWKDISERVLTVLANCVKKSSPHR